MSSTASPGRAFSRKLAQLNNIRAQLLVAVELYSRQHLLPDTPVLLCLLHVWYLVRYIIRSLLAMLFFFLVLSYFPASHCMHHDSK